jgi:hypothetical protein
MVLSISCLYSDILLPSRAPRVPDAINSACLQIYITLSIGAYLKDSVVFWKQRSFQRVKVRSRFSKYCSSFCRNSNRLMRKSSTLVGRATGLRKVTTHSLKLTTSRLQCPIKIGNSNILHKPYSYLNTFTLA